ncbi:MAG TPA: hypothetical protein VJQ56_11130 [Blastocatellia bacterium]|nr:hypothetical protein [Blastocatellia bacterium]
MDKRERFLTAAYVIAGALLASVLMTLFTEKTTVVAFIGWTIFFASIQATVFMTSDSGLSCTSWLKRFRRRD